jgi:predicted lactoylglutathione lyase
VRPDYSEPYYGCFVRDLDGHKIEAVYCDEALATKLGI